MATLAMALAAGTTESRADSCSASNSTLITRDAGGECSEALSLNQIFALTYRITNASVIDGGANDGDPVEASILSGNEIVATLAQEDAAVGSTELPTVLEFIPVCPVGSVGGSVAVGDVCTPNSADCGSKPCGCQQSQDGVTCEASGGNKVILTFDQDVVFAPSQQLIVAVIKVKSTDTVGPPKVCGEYFTRIDSTGDVITTTDDLCDSAVTAGAQASADLHAPECASDEDCGDTDCNVCADLLTDPHCEAANVGSSCGTDSDPDDCVAPACVDNAGVGVCTQGEIDEPEGTVCEGDGVTCTEDLCDDGGVCQHTPDDTICDDQNACTTEMCDAQQDCVYEFICEGENICRSPGYWATHSGDEKDGVNVGQLVIDAVGPLDVCGQSITDTNDLGSLDSDLEGLCVRVKGVKERQLYRQLMAAALNCGITGDDCETITDPLLDVSYDDCNDLCAGNPVVDGPTVNECIAQLDCFNNGGQMIDDVCVYDLPGNCHEAVLCNEDIDVCPKKTPASSSTACKEARANDCTIDDCN